MLGEKLGGHLHAPKRPWVEIYATYIDLIPQYPGLSVVPVARVPEPPVITEAIGKPKALKMAALGYRAAIENAYGEPSRVLIEATKSDYKAILGSKHATALIEAIPLMIENKIAPASWSAFSIMVWKNYVMSGSGKKWDTIPSKIRRPKRGMPPPPSWVFSQKRLQNRTDWFGWHEAHCRGGRLKISPAHKALMQKYESMRRALEDSPKLTKTRVATIIEEILPSSEYSRLINKAKADAEYEQDRMEIAMNNGAWLW